MCVYTHGSVIWDALSVCDTSQSLWSFFIPLSNCPGIMMPIPPDGPGAQKNEPMQMPWLFHNRNMERKPKNRCCQVSRIVRESRVSIRLLGEVSSNRRVLVPHRTASIRWLKNLLMSLAACKAEAVCWIHICVTFIMLYKPWEAF